MLDTRPSLLSSDITDSVESVGTTCTSKVYFVLDSLYLCSERLRQLQTVAQCDKEKLALHLVVHAQDMLTTDHCLLQCMPCVIDAKACVQCHVTCSDMERQHVQDKDAWKKNTIAQLKETRDRMQKLSENQLETLTKRTILENEAMAAELKYQSRQVRLQPACMSASAQ